MYEAHAKEQWIMHGRLAIDIINSMRDSNNQISPIGRYPFFEAPAKVKATAADELRLAEQLRGSQWLTVTKTT